MPKVRFAPHRAARRHKLSLQVTSRTLRGAPPESWEELGPPNNSRARSKAVLWGWKGSQDCLCELQLLPQYLGGHSCRAGCRNLELQQMLSASGGAEPRIPPGQQSNLYLIRQFYFSGLAMDSVPENPAGSGRCSLLPQTGGVQGHKREKLFVLGYGAHKITPVRSRLPD